MVVITKNYFAKLRAKHRKQVIVYCDGSFDLAHAGHVLFFEEGKALGSILVVGVGADIDIKRYKGDSRPVLSQSVRLKTVDSFKPVDYSFVNKLPNRKKLLSHLDSNFKKLKPDIYVINEDAFDTPFRKKISAKHGVKVIIAKRTCPPDFDAISTSNIIEKIKKIA